MFGVTSKDPIGGKYLNIEGDVKVKFMYYTQIWVLDSNLFDLTNNLNVSN